MSRRRELPKRGDVFEVVDEGTACEFTVVARKGMACLVEVVQTNPPLGRQRTGLMAIDHQGRAWTIYEPEPVEPWEG